MAKILIEKIHYGGWQNCLRITNGIIDLVATTDVGPRLIRFGFVGGANEFKEFPEMLGKTGGREWRAYGGHRLWYAPEHKVRTYYPDNFTVASDWGGGVLRLTQPVEKNTGIQKEILVKVSPGKAHVKVTHRLRNRGRRAIELAPWALTVMAPGGTAILPLPPRGSHPKDLLPANTLTLWAYTDMNDPRWKWGRRFILLQQSAVKLDKMPGQVREASYSDPTPQKIGAFVPDGWMAYANNNHLFVKKIKVIPGATYPDCGCNFETFTNKEMLEVESLGPLVTLKPRATIEHVEEWSLFRDVSVPSDDDDVEHYILPQIS